MKINFTTITKKSCGPKKKRKREKGSKPKNRQKRELALAKATIK